MDKEVSYSEMRKNLKHYLDQVCDTHEPLTIQRRRGQPVIVISQEDYDSLEETAYLSRSPRNLQRLLKAKSRHDGVSLEDIQRDLSL